MRQDLDKTPDGRPQGPTLHILSPLAPTIRRIGPPSPCIVGAGEDVDVGMGPLWLPVRAHHHRSSPSLKGIGACPAHHPSSCLPFVILSAAKDLAQTHKESPEVPFVTNAAFLSIMNTATLIHSR